MFLIDSWNNAFHLLRRIGWTRRIRRIRRIKWRMVTIMECVCVCVRGQWHRKWIRTLDSGLFCWRQQCSALTWRNFAFGPVSQVTFFKVKCVYQNFSFLFLWINWCLKKLWPGWKDVSNVRVNQFLLTLNSSTLRSKFMFNSVEVLENPHQDFLPTLAGFCLKENSVQVQIRGEAGGGFQFSSTSREPQLFWISRSVIPGSSSWSLNPESQESRRFSLVSFTSLSQRSPLAWSAAAGAADGGPGRGHRPLLPPRWL